MNETEVKIMSRSGQSVLVAWIDGSGKDRETYVLASLISDEGTIAITELELGIEQMTGFEEMLLDTEFAQQAACIADTLEQAGIKSQKSLQNAPRIVGHICNRDIYQIVEVLNKAFDKGA